MGFLCDLLLISEGCLPCSSIHRRPANWVRFLLKRASAFHRRESHRPQTDRQTKLPINRQSVKRAESKPALSIEVTSLQLGKALVNTTASGSQHQPPRFDFSQCTANETGIFSMTTTSEATSNVLKHIKVYISDNLTFSGPANKNDY